MSHSYVYTESTYQTTSTESEYHSTDSKADSFILSFFGLFAPRLLGFFLVNTGIFAYELYSETIFKDNLVNGVASFSCIFFVYLVDYFLFVLFYTRKILVYSIVSIALVIFIFKPKKVM